MQTDRPDPDALLAQVESETRKASRGKLKIFFGASPGVGKTYAMLQAARQQLSLGADVLVGLVETHQRADTASLLDGLEQLPLRQVAHRNRTHAQFLGFIDRKLHRFGGDHHSQPVISIDHGSGG